MVICKYYRQGNCRYGQYCQFEHINHFAGNTKTEDDIIIMVAKEVLLAERGGQWLLSCFAPLRERPRIPGMNDVSPEEVRWEMYHAQKNNTVEQARLQFQQLCEDMKAKREILKSPTRETITLLKRILGSNQKASQLGLGNNTSTNNVFGNTTFGVQSNNPFASSGFNSSNNTSSIFGKTNNNTALFGGATTFGNNLGGFGTATSGAGSIFGTTSTSTSFSGVQNSAPAFGMQNNSIFGGSSQNMFGQTNNVFAGTGQLGNTSNTSLFNSPMTSQANTPLFGSATTTASSLFGGSSTGLQTNSVFGASTTSSGSFNGGMFTQPKTQAPAFGGAPVFAGVTNYSSNSTGGSIFSGGQAFGPLAISTSGMFGGSTATPAFGTATTTTTPAFGTSVVAATAPGFGAPIATTTPAFDLSQQPSNNTAFGTTVSIPNVFGTQNTNTMSNNTPFGAPSAAISSPFVTTSSQQFDSTSTSSAPFVGAGFGVPVESTSNTFGTTGTSTNSIFANVGTTFATSSGTVPNPSPFSTVSFGNINSSSPFGSAAGTTLTTTTTTNPFAPWPQQQGSSPFGNVTQNQTGIKASPFGESPFNAATTNLDDIDDSVYSLDNDLTDDEKKMFMADRFIMGRIPLKPPTKDMR